MSKALALASDWVRSMVEQVKLRFARRFSLALTTEGYFMVGAMLLIGLAALNTGAPLLYLMFSMMCSFFILSALLATNTIRSLEVERSFSRVWPAGKPLPVELTLRNNKLLTSSYSIRVTDLMAGKHPTDPLKGAQASGGAFYDRIPPQKGKVTESYECLFLRRGMHHFAALEVATRFPFGLIERVITYPAKAPIMILPQTISVDSIMRQARSELGEYETNRKGMGSGLYGLREYTPDMPAKDIHWKISARRGLLMAREYESEEKRRACVLLDNAVPADQRAAAAEPLERAVVLAASVIEWLCLHDHEVELRTASGVVGFGSGRPHLSRCLRALAELDFVEPRTLDREILSGSVPGVFGVRIHFAGAALAELSVDGFSLHIDECSEALTAAFDPPGEEPRRPTPLHGFREGTAT